jgi:hypothetical protein
MRFLRNALLLWKHRRARPRPFVWASAIVGGPSVTRWIAGGVDCRTLGDAVDSWLRQAGVRR